MGDTPEDPSRKLPAPSKGGTPPSDDATAGDTAPKAGEAISASRGGESPTQTAETSLGSGEPPLPPPGGPQGAAASPSPAQPPLPLPPDGIADLKNELVSGELAEVILLLDHLSGRPDRTISNLRLDENHPDLVQAVFAAHWPPQTGETEAEISDAATIMFKARDQLNELAYPANGASIAFTIMVTGEDSSENNPAAGGKIRTTRSGLASRAYPRYRNAARDFRRFRMWLLFLLVVTISLTSFLSWNLTEGHFFLQTIKDDDAKRAALLPELYQALSKEREAQLVATMKQGGSTTSVPNCTNSSDGIPSPACSVTVDQYCISSFGVQDPVSRLRLCSQLRSLSLGRCIAVDSLTQWYRAWPWIKWLLGAPTTRDSRPATDANQSQPVTAKQCSTGDALDPIPSAIEQDSAEVVQVLGSAVLPMLYGLLGALAAIGLSIHHKTKESSLMPRDRAQMRLQALLGVVVGGTIGLFLTPTTATSALGTAASNVTLSASGLSFIAGLGVDRVFKWLDNLIQAIFGAGATQPTPPPRPIAPRPSPPAAPPVGENNPGAPLLGPLDNAISGTGVDGAPGTAPATT